MNISSPGWYLLSGLDNMDVGKKIVDAIHDYKESSDHNMILQNKVYHFNGSWENMDIFYEDDWDISDINDIIDGNKVIGFM